MNYITQLGQQVGSQAVSGILGMIMGGINDRRQIKQQQKLTDMQLAADKSMTDYSHARQLDMWRATSYPAQLEMLKKAGLNAGLIYGMGGAGGQTTGAGSAHVAAPAAPSGGGEIMGMMQLRAQEAQIKLLEAQARNLDADTSNKPLTGENIQADTQNKRANTLFQEQHTDRDCV